MNLNTEYQLYSIGTHPEFGGHTNVVAQAQWGSVSTRSGFVSRHYAHTLLPLAELSSFTPIEQLTKEQILSWAIAAEGGDPYLQLVAEHQDRDLTMQERAAGVVFYGGQLSFYLDQTPIAG